MILAIDTAGPWVAVAAGKHASALASCKVTARLNHNEELAARVATVLKEAGGERPLAIALDVGPGSFTGTRVGVAYGVGLAQGWHLPLYTFSSFAVAADLAPAESERVAVALPYVRGEWCRAFLAREPAGWQEEALVELKDAGSPADLKGTPLLVPWGEYAGAVTPPASWNPAVALWRLASRAPADRLRSPEAVAVRYVGPSQAERKFRARHQT